MKYLLIVIIYLLIVFNTSADVGEIDIDYYNIELKEMTLSTKYWSFEKKELDKNYFYLNFLKENFREYYDYYIYYLAMSRDMSKMRDDFVKGANIPDGLSISLFFSRNFKVEYNIGYKFKLYFDSEKIAKGEIEW